MTRPEKILNLKIGEGELSLDGPPADLETVLSTSGKFLAVIWPKPDGHYRVDLRRLVYVDHLERHGWEEMNESSVMASMNEARQFSRDALARLDHES